MHVEELLSKNLYRVDSIAVFDAMNGKCAKEKCSLCTCKFQGRRHQHLERWCPNCARSGDSLKSKRVDLCYGGLIVNLVGVHDSSWEDW